MSAPARGNEPLAPLETSLLAVGTLFALVLAIESAYAWLNASLFAAAERAATGANHANESTAPNNSSE